MWAVSETTQQCASWILPLLALVTSWHLSYCLILWVHLCCEILGTHSSCCEVLWMHDNTFFFHWCISWNIVMSQNGNNEMLCILWSFYNSTFDLEIKKWEHFWIHSGNYGGARLDVFLNTFMSLLHRKYVKEEKGVREDIVRMSSKPMLRVQEETAALKQLLSVVSNGLQRNACTLEKLKAEMTQVCFFPFFFC